MCSPLVGPITLFSGFATPSLRRDTAAPFCQVPSEDRIKYLAVLVYTTLGEDDDVRVMAPLDTSGFCFSATRFCTDMAGSEALTGRCNYECAGSVVDTSEILMRYTPRREGVMYGVIYEDAFI